MAAPSVVLLRSEPLVPEVRWSALLGALRECGADLDSGAFVSLDWSDKPRARVLPLRLLPCNYALGSVGVPT